MPSVPDGGALQDKRLVPSPNKLEETEEKKKRAVTEPVEVLLKWCAVTPALLLGKLAGLSSQAPAAPRSSPEAFLPR